MLQYALTPLSSLDLIGQWAEAASAHGFLFAPKSKSELTVKQALVQAANLLQTTSPEKAKHFQDMNQGLWEREPWFPSGSNKKGNT